MTLEEGNRTTRPEAETEPGVGFRDRMTMFQSSFSRFVATGGIIGIGTGLAAILGSQDVEAWIIGIVVSGLSVILAAIVWSARG
ncbi:MAG TPA: hypothetical protein VK273_00455 [Gaiellaceae bacterium]|nr:hypothetical protein [Gaiellaceae bacterium]